MFTPPATSKEASWELKYPSSIEEESSIIDEAVKIGLNLVR